MVVGDRLPECRLPQFLESDPDLIANILQWLHNIDESGKDYLYLNAYFILIKLSASLPQGILTNS
ncbi:MAG: hypothetical protein KFF72_09390 [Arthrospira sp. SH-MAG29]|nr:hypothetical protein [Arthrospira sp. SH-MAG29]MBS0016553.1 hypothetical protein [Arthrospira sp. SH-MAG29]